jgi:hypothetical protein
MGVPKIHQFDPVIYPIKLWIIKNPTPESISENFITHDRLELNTNNSEATTASTYNKVVVKKDIQKYGVLVKLYGKISVPDVAHEATHAARLMWDWLGEDGTGVEADAYLVGWIADCINQVRTNKFK